MDKKLRGRKSIPVIIALVLAAMLILIIAVASGGKPQTRNPIGSPPIPAVIPETTKVLSQQSLDSLDNISADGAAYIFTQISTDLVDLKPGDVMVGSISNKTPNGFVRKVISTTQANSQIVVQTSDATLTDLIRDGTIEFSQKITPADVQAVNTPSGVAHMASPSRLNDEFVFKVSDLIVGDEDGDLSTDDDQVRLNGTYTFGPELNLRVDIQNNSYQDIYFAVGGTHKVEIDIECKSEYLKLSGETLISSIPLHSMVVMVGHVPVVLTPVIEVFAGVDGDISIGAQFVSPVVTMKAGFSYDGSKFDLIKELDFKSGYKEPQFNPSIKADYKGFFRVGPTIYFYGVPGPNISAKIFLQAEVEPLAVPPAKLYAGISTDAFLQFKIFDLKIPKKEFNILSYRIMISPQAHGQNPVIPIGQTQSTMVTSPTVDLVQEISYENQAAPTAMPAPSTGDVSSETVLVFDTSGSMENPDVSGMTKMQAAIKAGGVVLDLIYAENQIPGVLQNKVGAVMYSTDTQTISNLSTDISSVRSGINGMVPDSATGMAGGLDAAIEMLKGQSDNTTKIIVLMTDGKPNVMLGGSEFAEDQNVVKDEIIQLSKKAGNLGFCVYTIGLGDPGSFENGEPSLDEELLKEVAANSGCGEYYLAKDAMNLSNVYITLRHKSTGKILLDETDTISEGEKKEVGDVFIDQNQERMMLTLNWPGSKIGPVVLDPSGQEVDENYPGAYLSETDSNAVLIIQEPITGQWKLAALGIDVPEGITDFHMVVSSKQGQIPTPLPTIELVVPAPEDDGGGIVGIVLIILLIAIGGVFIFVSNTSRNRKKSGSSNIRHAVFILPNGMQAALTDGMIIGRSSSSGIYLDDSSVSRIHAQIRYSQGGWFIQDMQSKRGIYVNGRLVNATRLISGDQVKLGNSLITFREI